MGSASNSLVSFYVFMARSKDSCRCFISKAYESIGSYSLSDCAASRFLPLSEKNKMKTLERSELFKNTNLKSWVLGTATNHISKE